ncbi:MAG: hypothetical protein ACYCW6_29330, partial [Candidatus Xenobia bacterium]
FDQVLDAVAPVAAGSSSSHDRRSAPEPAEAPEATAPVAETAAPPQDQFVPSADLDEMAAEAAPVPEPLTDLQHWLEQARENLKKGDQPAPRLLRMRPRPGLQENFRLVET